MLHDVRSLCRINNPLWISREHPMESTKRIPIWRHTLARSSTHACKINFADMLAAVTKPPPVNSRLQEDA
jgi:hypothetical protein